MGITADTTVILLESTETGNKKGIWRMNACAAIFVSIKTTIKLPLRRNIQGNPYKMAPVTILEHNRL